MLKRLLFAWKSSFTALATIGTLTAICLGNTPALAATATAPTLSIALDDTSSTIGEAIPIFATLSPAMSNIPVRTEEWSTADGSWEYVGSVAAKTNASGQAKFLFTAHGKSGFRTLRLIAVVNGNTIVSGSASLTAYYDSSSSPGASASIVADGNLIDQLNFEFCEDISHLFDVGGLTGPEAEFVATFYRTAYSEAMCHNKNLSEALKTGFAEALWAYPFSKIGDGIAEASWGPVVKRLLDKAHADAVALDSEFVKRIFNGWLLQLVTRLIHQQAACIEAHKFTQTSGCNTVPQEAALEAERIR